MNEVKVALPSGIEYPVIIGNGAKDRLPSLIPPGAHRAEDSMGDRCRHLHDPRPHAS